MPNFKDMPRVVAIAIALFLSVGIASAGYHSDFLERQLSGEKVGNDQDRQTPTRSASSSYRSTKVRHGLVLYNPDTEPVYNSRNSVDTGNRMGSVSKRERGDAWTAGYRGTYVSKSAEDRAAASAASDSGEASMYATADDEWAPRHEGEYSEEGGAASPGNAEMKGAPTYEVGETFRGPYPIGPSVALFAGMNMFQSASSEIRIDGGVGNDSFDIDSQIQPSIGFKLTYTIPIAEISEPRQWVDRFESRSVPGKEDWLLGMEVEMMYHNLDGLSSDVSTYGGLVAPDLKFEYDMDTFVFNFNGFVALQTGPFRPYLGLGVGGAAVFFNDPKYIQFGQRVPGFIEDTHDVFFTANVMTGVDYFLYEDWSIFTEYRFMVIDDLIFKYDNATVDFENYEQHLLHFGARYHFW